MKDFLAKLPPLLATLSKAFLIALREQTLEVARALRKLLHLLGQLFVRLARWLWAIYYQVETQILGVIVDLVLAVVALRYFFLLLMIGVVLVYFKQWLFVVVYVLLLSTAALRYFRIDSETAAQQEEHHKQSHATFIRLLRWPLRALASVMLLYASSQFIERRSLSVLWSHQNPVETRKVEETRKGEETQQAEKARKTEDTKAEEEDRQRENARLENERAKKERMDKQRAEKERVEDLWSGRSQQSKKPSPPPAATPSRALMTDHGPSFDRAKATYTSERLVCSSPDLALLDLSLANAYRDAAARSDSSGKAFLRDQQNHWLRHVREKCQNVECLLGVYEARIYELKAMKNGIREHQR